MGDLVPLTSYLAFHSNACVMARHIDNMDHGMAPWREVYRTANNMTSTDNKGDPLEAS